MADMFGYYPFVIMIIWLVVGIIGAACNDENLRVANLTG